MTDVRKAAVSSTDVYVRPITVRVIFHEVALGKLPRPAPPGFNGSLSGLAASGWDDAVFKQYGVATIW